MFPEILIIEFRENLGGSLKLVAEGTGALVTWLPSFNFPKKTELVFERVRKKHFKLAIIDYDQVSAYKGRAILEFIKDNECPYALIYTGESRAKPIEEALALWSLVVGSELRQDPDRLTLAIVDKFNPSQI